MARRSGGVLSSLLFRQAGEGLAVTVKRRQAREGLAGSKDEDCDGVWRGDLLSNLALVFWNHWRLGHQNMWV